MSLVPQQKGDIGIATDGDADRIGIIDENGQFLTQLQVFALLCLYLLEIRGERGPLVKTITSTSMLDRLGELFKVPVYETPVGFKYVAPVMIANNALIGGEESGGYGFRGHIPSAMLSPPGSISSTLWSKPARPHHNYWLIFTARWASTTTTVLTSTSPKKIDRLLSTGSRTMPPRASKMSK